MRVTRSPQGLPPRATSSTLPTTGGSTVVVAEKPESMHTPPVPLLANALPPTASSRMQPSRSTRDRWSPSGRRETCHSTEFSPAVSRRDAVVVLRVEHGDREAPNIWMKLKGVEVAAHTRETGSSGAGTSTASITYLLEAGRFRAGTTCSRNRTAVGTPTIRMTSRSVSTLRRWRPCESRSSRSRHRTRARR